MSRAWKNIYFELQRSTIKVTRHKKQRQCGFLASADFYCIIVFIIMDTVKDRVNWWTNPKSAGIG